MTQWEQAQFQDGLLEGVRLGTAAVPGLLLRTYAKLGLSEIETMLLIHMIYFATHEQVLFPTPEQLSERMSTSPSQVLTALEKLLRDGFVEIDEGHEEYTDLRVERYNLSPLFSRMAAVWDEIYPRASDFSRTSGQVTRPMPTGTPTSTQGSLRGAARREQAEARRKNLFTVFESEFARPISPMEYETIVGWLDEDQYEEPLIMAALKEAVFAGKVHFRYIDRILLEWRRNRITTAEEAKAYTEQFRGGR